MAADTADLGQFDLTYTVFADMSVKIFRLKHRTVWSAWNEVNVLISPLISCWSSFSLGKSPFYQKKKKKKGVNVFLNITSKKKKKKKKNMFEY